MGAVRGGNAALRRALVDARLSEAQVAERVGVDPKTVQRWLAGRVPVAGRRRAVAELLGRHEYDLWPADQGLFPLAPELRCTYPHRGAVPRSVWGELFERARERIDVLAYSALFLVEDVELLGLLEARARAGVRVRIALGDSWSRVVQERGDDERIGHAMAAKVRNAWVLADRLRQVEGVSLRRHDTVLYASVYRGDEVMLVNQHVYGLPAAAAPVLRLEGPGEMFSVYSESFERVWERAADEDPDGEERHVCRAPEQGEPVPA